MTNDLISREADEIRKAAKIKTHFARIVVGGPVMNPCYSILWYDPSDRDYHIGYSSYSLMNVYDWLRDEFEITGSPFDNEPVAHGKWIHCAGKSNLWYCSECGGRIMYSQTCRTYQINKPPVSEANKFCKHCGAKMDGEG